jgi:hypothetical protein
VVRTCLARVAHGLSDKLNFFFLFYPLILLLCLERNCKCMYIHVSLVVAGTRYNLADGSTCLTAKPFSTLSTIAWHTVFTEL